MQLLEDLLEQKKREMAMQEELETLKEISRSEKQKLADVLCDRGKLRLLCDEKDSALQVTIIIW